MSDEINSKEYWDDRFQKDWEIKNGRQQTEVFYNLLIKNIPNFVKEFIRNNSDTINDVGCALGEGTVLLQKIFKNNSLIGTDFSETAIKNAKKNFKDIQFEVQNVLTSKKKYDVIIASNIIEHFPKPFDVLQKVLDNSKQIAIVMIPFQEDKNNMEKEHSQSFDFEDFRLFTNDFCLIYSKEINLMGTPDGAYWYGKQLLLIYGKKNLFPIENLTLNNYIMDKNENKLLSSTTELENFKKDLESTMANQKILNTKIERLNESIMAKSSIIDSIYSSRSWHAISRYRSFLNKHPKIKKIIQHIKR